jgi:hypothetical protein
MKVPRNRRRNDSSDRVMAAFSSKSRARSKYPIRQLVVIRASEFRRRGRPSGQSSRGRATRDRENEELSGGAESAGDHPPFGTWQQTALALSVQQGPPAQVVTTVCGPSLAEQVCALSTQNCEAPGGAPAAQAPGHLLVQTPLTQHSLGAQTALLTQVRGTVQHVLPIGQVLSRGVVPAGLVSAGQSEPETQEPEHVRGGQLPNPSTPTTGGNQFQVAPSQVAQVPATMPSPATVP